MNFRLGWRGHLWQGRFAWVGWASRPSNRTSTTRFAGGDAHATREVYMLTCARYIELNPVRAGLSASAAEYRWSSAAAGWHWQLVCQRRQTRADKPPVAPNLQTGRPLGSEGFLTRAEAALGRALRPRRRGPKKKAATMAS